MLQWIRGRLLSAYGSNTYKYDANGIRLEKKTASGVTHKYWTEGERIHREYRSNGETLWYYYDASGIEGFSHSGVRYHYLKNLQGDIVGITNSDGNLVAQYFYDAWGNHKVCDGNGYENTSTGFIGNVNPFRYRGYYFDIETGLYYLQSRYYDPEFGRFINADDVSVLTSENAETLGGLNLYAYCGNNPVMNVDPTGYSFLVYFIAAVVGFAVSFASSAISQGVFNEGQVNWGIAAIDGLFGAILGALWMIPGLGAVATGCINAGLTALNTTITTGIENNWNFDKIDISVIVLSSALSGFVSGKGRSNFLKHGGKKILMDTHKQIGNIIKRLGNGYYFKSGNFKLGQRAVNSAKTHIVKSLVNLNFGKGFYKDWIITLLAAIFSITFSKGLKNIKW